MARYRFDEIAFNITDKRMPTPEDKELYIGLEHLDTRCLRVSRWGSAVDITGQKLVMRKGDVLFGRRNTYLRRAAIAPHDGLFSAHGMIFRPKTNVITEEFFPYFIVSNYFMDAAIRISVGSLSPTVNWKQLKELEFDIPDIDKQHKYAELFAAIDSTKEAYKQLISATDELVKSQFIEMFGEGNADERYIPLKDCCADISGGKTPSMSHPEYYGGSIPFVKSGDVKSTSVSSGALWLTDDALEKAGIKLVPKDSVIVVIRSAALRHEFNIAVAQNPIVINQDLKALQPKSEFLPLYLLWAIKSREDMLLSKVQTVLTSHIEMTDLTALPVMVVSIERQKLFCEFVEQADKSKFVVQIAIYRDVWGSQIP